MGGYGELVFIRTSGICSLIRINTSILLMKHPRESVCYRSRLPSITLVPIFLREIILPGLLRFSTPKLGNPPNDLH